VGEGGIGKTRLALAVAQAILDLRFEILDSEAVRTENPKSKIQNPKFPDGVWFVPLTGLALTDDLSERLAGAIATAMQLSLKGQATLGEQLFRHLQAKQSLLILDSFEHLLEGADFILDLLRNTTATKVLVTSRHILNFQAEYTWRVEGLSVPPQDRADALAPELLLRYDSVALFVERARRVMRGFALTAKNQQEVMRICQFVQGLPLGAELAAALTRHYTCAEIMQALEQNYAILTTAQRDIPPRHRSIQATLAYSWSFLSAEEARVATQCSLFRSGFTLEAAAQIMGADLALLTALEDHSLLRLARGDGNERRYEMHELVRQYAAQQLQSTPALVQQTEQRFCAYYTDFIRAREEALVQGKQAEEEIQAELNNLRRVWQWAVDHTDILALAKSTDGFLRFYYLKGMYQAGELAARSAITAIRRALQEDGAASPPRSLAQGYTSEQLAYELVRSLLAQGRFCERLARLAEAEELTQEGIQRAQALGAVELEGRGY